MDKPDDRQFLGILISRRWKNLLVKKAKQNFCTLSCLVKQALQYKYNLENNMDLRGVEPLSEAPPLKRSSKKSKNKALKVIGTFVLIIIISCQSFAHPIDLSIISKIESSNNPNAKSYCCHGLYQLSEGVLKDYNQSQRSNYRKSDLYNPQINQQIADWHIERLWKKYQSIEDVLIAYNFGPANLKKYKAGLIRLPQETQNYLKKYKDLGGKL